MEFKSLSEISSIDISGVDKKIKSGQRKVRLCNFTDVYYNWSVGKNNVKSFMESTASENEIERFSLKKGYVAITKDSETRDDIGVPCYITDDLDNTILGYHCALIVPDENIIDGSFLNVYLNSKMARTYFSNQAGGSGQRYTLTIDGIGAVKIPMLPLTQQRRIGDLFSKIDKKIELNKSINDELYNMSKDLFDYYFHQYDFPNIDGKPYASSNGEMVKCEEIDRFIPKDWELVSFDKIFDFSKGKTPDELYSSQQDGTDLYLTIEIVNGGYPIYCDINGMPYCNGETIMVMDGAASGDIYVGHKGVLGSTFSKLISKREDVSDSLIYMILNSYKKAYKRANTGSTVPHANADYIGKMKIALPKDCSYFSNCFSEILKKIFKNNMEIRDLISLRDFLLPVLVNGQAIFKEENKYGKN